MLCVGLKPYARRAISPGSCTEESLIQQKNVERDDEEDYDRRNGRGETVIDERAHNVPVAAEDEQRHERERDAEREHDLAEHERARVREGQPGGLVVARAEQPAERVGGKVDMRVGERWESGDWNVAQEHAATCIAERVVAALLLGGELGGAGRFASA